MNTFTLLLAENITWVLVTALILFTVVTISAVRRVRRTARRLERRPRSWLAFGAALVYLVVGLAGLVLFSNGAVRMGPGLIGQMKIRGEPAPELAYLRVVDGAAGQLADHKGKVVLVNLWATWCPPCRAEMPDLERLQQTYGDDGLVVLQISDEEHDTLAAFLAEQPMTTEHGYVTEMPWPVPGRPTSYVVDRGGIVRQAMIGGRHFEQFEEEIKKHL